jgi:hypothetical protein
MWENSLSLEILLDLSQLTFYLLMWEKICRKFNLVTLLKICGINYRVYNKLKQNI